jgi:DNA-binding NarL/FixJ family response regulator
MACQDEVTPRRVLVGRRVISVLLIDDQRLVGVALKRLLASEQDIELHCCYDSVDAVARANQINPTIILQDLVLPDTDGLTMVRMFRANPPTAGTPIVVLSGNDDSGTRARALAAGADDYLVKLPDRIDLVAAIRRHAIGGAALDSGDGTASRPQLTAASDPDANETLDGRVLAEFRLADTVEARDFTLRLIDEFIKEAASQVDLLKDAQQRQDVGALSATTHSLKGSALTMGARRLATLCTQLEVQADHPDGAVASALITELDQEFVRVRNALQATREGVSHGQMVRELQSGGTA